MWMLNKKTLLSLSTSASVYILVLICLQYIYNIKFCLYHLCSNLDVLRNRWLGCFQLLML